MARRKGRRGDPSPRHEGTAEGRADARAGARVRTLAAAALGIALAAPADAAVFNVTNTNNTGAGSLRQAIAAANGAAGADVITFQAGLTGTITLFGQLAVTDSVDIQGPGAAVLTVSGNNIGRVFYLHQPNALIDVTISRLTITGGIATSGSPNGIVFGGGILDEGENLTLDQVVITGNRAGGFGVGGGLSFYGEPDLARLVIRDSTISGNSANGNFKDGGGQGGGVEISSGQVLIQRTAITGNNAYSDGGGAFFNSAGPVTIEDCTISGNVSAVGGGGGLRLTALFGQQLALHTIRRSTISGNSGRQGGGLETVLWGNAVLVENSTISGNHTTGFGGGDGAGAYIFSTITTLRHTTIANNTADNGHIGGVFAGDASIVLDHVIAGDNATGDLGSTNNGSFDVRFSLVENAGTANVTDSGGNIFNRDPLLGNLGNNGGPTQTHLPAGTSAAVNAGDPAFAPPPASDQRGSARVVGGRIDMGAVEVSSGTVQLTTSAVAVAENALTVTITATRTGGAEGAVAASYATADGTAVAPADYGSAAGVLSWADQDSAPKSFQVTIVDDTLDEVDETFVATLTNPQGGAGLGTSTQEVTILDNDEPIVITPAEEIPTLSEWALTLLAALLGACSLAFLRKR